MTAEEYAAAASSVNSSRAPSPEAHSRIPKPRLRALR
jgi:hypothetical protein